MPPNNVAVVLARCACSAAQIPRESDTNARLLLPIPGATPLSADAEQSSSLSGVRDCNTKATFLIGARPSLSPSDACSFQQ